MYRNQHKRALREGRAREIANMLVCVTSIHICGGSPACPRRWVRIGISRWVKASWLRPAGNIRSGWNEATHYIGNCLVRMATDGEQRRTPHGVLGDIYRGRLIDASPATCAARHA